MPKITDIKNRIDQLDGGTFQNLCDTYLACLGYKNMYSLGMKEGTSKTAKGTPDTYFLNADGNYVFVMYTTQKTDFLKKALDDIMKCFEFSKTGVIEENIAEIIFCHTYGRLTPGEDKRLRDFCTSKNTLLVLKGIDDISTDLFLHHHRVAKDFLDISVDTGQILSADDFVKSCDENKMSAPLSTAFISRTSEKEDLYTKLQTHDVVVITGPAGVGKTRLALEVCTNYASENNADFYCIRSKHLEIYEDIKNIFALERKYVILVDDANELSGLHHVLAYLSDDNYRNCVKIVITVRDYAKQNVTQSVLGFSKYATVRVSIFTDEEISTLMEEHFGIRNRLYTERIISIAEGNPRLAMLAGKVASENENLDSIRDASELYDSYYRKQIDDILSGSSTAIISAGIIAFMLAIHLEHLEHFSEAFQIAGISELQFVSDLKQLHDLELVDIYNDKAARVSDQSFGNFLIKYVFVDRKLIPLSTIIESCFFVNKLRTVAACNVLLTVFSDEAVRKFVEQDLNIVWEHLKPNPERFMEFLKSFHMIRPTETLSTVHSHIDALESVEFDVKSIDFKKANNGRGVTNDIIQLLASFNLHQQLPEAIDLLLLYYKKRPDLFMQIYWVFTGRFSIDKDSDRFDYYTQTKVVERLEILICDDFSDEILALYIRVAADLLRLFYTPTEGGRHNTFVMYRIPLRYTDAVIRYRTTLWDRLLCIYRAGRFVDEIEELIYNYGNDYDDGIDYTIVEAELERILMFFQSDFSKNTLFHCILANHIKKISKRAGVPTSKDILAFLDSESYKIYDMLTKHYYDRDLGYEESELLRKKEIAEFVRGYSLERIQRIFEICTQSASCISMNEYAMSVGLSYVFQAISNDPTLFIQAVQSYIQSDTPGNMHPHSLISQLFKLMPCDEVYRLIQSANFKQQNAWLWCFFTQLPSTEVSMSRREQLLSFLEKPPLELESSGFRPINALRIYEDIDTHIIVTASRIVAAHYEESPFVFHLYFSLLFNPQNKEIDDLISLFKSDFELLCEIYLKAVTYSSHEDHDGSVLMKLIEIKPNFLVAYLEKMIIERKHDYFSLSEPALERLRKIWLTPNYIKLMKTILNHLFEYTNEFKWRFSGLLTQMLVHEKDDAITISNQDEWVKALIEENCCDEDYMYILFDALSELSEERRRTAVKLFVNLNPDYEAFRKLPLEASHWGGSGSMIPYMQRRIDYLSSLIPYFSGVKYLKHKQRIENDIQVWQARIEREEIDELLEQ